MENKKDTFEINHQAILPSGIETFQHSKKHGTYISTSQRTWHMQIMISFGSIHPEQCASLIFDNHLQLKKHTANTFYF